MSIDARMHATQGSPRPSGPRRRSAAYVHARAVGAYVPKLTRKAFEKYGFSAATLLTDWAAIVGEEIAGVAVPERLKWPRDVRIREDVEAGAEGRPGAVLVLRVDPARALDVEYKGRQILERINGYFGYRAIAELRILQAPLAQARSGGRQPRHAGALRGARACGDRGRAPARGPRTAQVGAHEPRPCRLTPARGLPFLHLAFRRHFALLQRSSHARRTTVRRPQLGRAPTACP